PAGKEARAWRWSCVKLVEEFQPPLSRLILNPFHEKWECRNADMVNGICCFPELIARGGGIEPDRCGCGQRRYPKAEWVPIVGGFVGGHEGEEGKDYQQSAGSAEE